MVTIEDLLEKGKTLRGDEAEKHYTGLIDQTSLLLAKAHNARGISYRMSGKFAEALEDYTEVFRVTADEEEFAAAHINIADVLRVSHKNWDDAHLSIKHALSLVEPDRLIAAKAIDQRGLIYRAEGKLTEALKDYSTAIATCEDIMINPKRSIEFAETMDRMGQIFQHYGEAALDLYQETKDPEVLQQVTESQKRVIEIYQDKNPIAVINARKVLGNVAFELENYEEALKQHIMGQEHYKMEEVDYDRLEGVMALHIARDYLALDQVPEAVPYLETFADLATKGTITAADLNVLKPVVLGTVDLYQKLELKIDEFDPYVV